MWSTPLFIVVFVQNHKASSEEPNQFWWFFTYLQHSLVPSPSCSHTPASPVAPTIRTLHVRTLAVMLNELFAGSNWGFISVEVVEWYLLQGIPEWKFVLENVCGLLLSSMTVILNVSWPKVGSLSCYPHSSFLLSTSGEAALGNSVIPDTRAEPTFWCQKALLYSFWKRTTTKRKISAKP